MSWLTLADRQLPTHRFASAAVSECVCLSASRRRTPPLRSIRNKSHPHLARFPPLVFPSRTSFWFAICHFLTDHIAKVVELSLAIRALSPFATGLLETASALPSTRDALPSLLPILLLGPAPPCNPPRTTLALELVSVPPSAQP